MSWKNQSGFNVFMLQIICIGLISLVKINSGEILNLTFMPRSSNSILVRWNSSHRQANHENYTIQYRFDGQGKTVHEVTVRARASNYTLKNLQSHSVYKLRAAVQNENTTGRFSRWKTVRLDVKTYLIRVQLPSETKVLFQKKLYEVFPLSFLSSKEINSTRIDFDNSMVEVFYKVYFGKDMNETSEQLSEMFARNYARAQTTFIRNVHVLEHFFCKTARNTCSRFANCKETIGSYSCQCKEGYIDFSADFNIFPGRNCSLNTDKPGDMRLSVINPTTILMKFRSPRSILGKIRHYQVEYQTISGDPTSIQSFKIGKSGMFMERRVGSLMAFGLHQFRARAITDRAPGKWTKWSKIRTAPSSFKVIFNFLLKKSTTNYQKIKNKIHQEVTRKVITALLGSKSLEMTDFEIIRSDHTSDLLVRVQAYLFTAPKRRIDIDRMQRSVRARFRSRFTSTLGQIEENTAILEDVDECKSTLGDCAGNKCINKLGKFICECPERESDVSDDFFLLPGRKCIVFDSPLSFFVTLINPTSVNLNWKLPPQMRIKLSIWFVVQYRLQLDEAVIEEIVTMTDADYSVESYVISWTIKNLHMSSVYLFRVAAANIDDIGSFTEWKSIETSSLIFEAKLNLTKVMFSKELQNKNHDLATETIKKVQKLISRVMQKIPQFTEAGNVTFTPGLKDRTFANVYLFFKNRGNWNRRRVLEIFKHNSVFDGILGLDFQSVNVSDLNECRTSWSDCSKNATCTNTSPGFSCACDEDFVDLSEMQTKLPGRVCAHKDSITTPQPTTTAVTISTTQKVILPFPKVSLYGSAVSPTKLRLKWQSLSRNQQRRVNLNYDLQYRVKGLPEWTNVTVSSITQNLDINSLYRGVIYQVRLAERWNQNSDPHTTFTIPIEVRTVPKAFRIFLQLPEVPAVSNVLSSRNNPEKTMLSTYVSNYLTDLFNHPDVRNKYRTLRFGSIGDVSFSKHPDKGVIASAILYLSEKSSASTITLDLAFKVGEKIARKSMPIKYMHISDLDECSSQSLNDCSPTSQCTNTIGGFICRCWYGFDDAGPSYYLLSGRYCLSNGVSTTSSRSSTTLSIENKRTRTPTDLKVSPKTRLNPIRKPNNSGFIRPVNKIGLQSGKCLKGQKLIRSDCEDVSFYMGKITILKESGNNVTASSVSGKAGDFLKEAVEKALDTAFSDIELMVGFYKAKVQALSVENEDIRALFVVIINFPKIRFRRQTDFINDFEEIKADSIRKFLREYLNEIFPRGNVKPSNGAAIMFGLDNLIITDVNECDTFQTMHDCDVSNGLCRNTEGSFECECKPGTVDKSFDIVNRPGRRCMDQCNPSPCLHGAACISQPHVGAPSCLCPTGYTGLLCKEETDEEGPNLLVIALASIAGALLIFIIGIIITYYTHKKNKKRERKVSEMRKYLNDHAGNNSGCEGQISENPCDRAVLESIDTDAQALPTNTELTPDENVVATSNESNPKLSSPPPIPPRASLKFKGLQLKSLSAGKPDSTPTPVFANYQQTLSSESTVLDTNSNHQSNNLSISAISFQNKNISKNKKRRATTKSSAIRGRIRRHSDDSS